MKESKNLKYDAVHQEDRGKWNCLRYLCHGCRNCSLALLRVAFICHTVCISVYRSKCQALASCQSVLLH